MSWPPHVTVAAIVTRNDHFLMVEELDQGSRVINQPAGHLEPNESLDQAVVREVHEETGYWVEPTAVIGLYQYQAPNSGPLFLRLCFAAELVSHSSDPIDPDILDVLWLDRTDIHQRSTRSPLVERCIDDYLAGHQHPLHFYASVLS